MTHNDHCHDQFSLDASCFWMQVPSLRDAHSVFSLKPTAAVPCDPAVTSPPVTMMSTTLTTFSFSCLRTLPLRPLCLKACLRLMFYTQPLVVDLLLIFSRSRSNFPLHLIPSHFLTILSSPHSEHGCFTCIKIITSCLDHVRYSCHPRWLYLEMMTTPRTHCHFVMQARALRFPEFCVYHTSPSYLVVYSLAKMVYRSVNTFMLPDPWHTR